MKARAVTTHKQAERAAPILWGGAGATPAAAPTGVPAGIRVDEWRAMVLSCADYVPASGDPGSITLAAAASLARPFNSDIACEVSLAGVAMIVEHHRAAAGDAEGLIRDLTVFLTTMAKQRQMGI